MKHLSRIQGDFIKEAIKNWDDASLEYQKDYLKKHPGAKKKLTGRPRAQIEKEKRQKIDRTFHVVGDSVHVDLGHGEHAIVDRSDYGIIRHYKWSLKNSGGNKYAQAYVNGKVRLMHRMIAEDIAGRVLAENENVDWKNGNTLDNRRENLSF